MSASARPVRWGPGTPLRPLGPLVEIQGVRMLHFLKDWWKFIQIHQYYTMALSGGHTTWEKCPQIGRYPVQNVEVSWYIGLNHWLWIKRLRVRLPGTFALQQDILSTLLLSTQVYKWVPGRMRMLSVAWCGMCVPLKRRLAKMLPREKVHYECRIDIQIQIHSDSDSDSFIGPWYKTWKFCFHWHFIVQYIQ